MTYLNQKRKVVYASNDGKSNRIFPVMEWLTNLCSHIPNRGEQIVI
jgi:hypothetical protein